MSRIRTIKPEMARHGLLFDTEKETGLPIRFAWAMLPTACCREGRFKWRPRELKVDILPHDDVDFSRVLDALLTRGFVVKYRVGNEWFGFIPTFLKHQVVNNREQQSDLPDISEADEVVTHASGTRQARVDHASQGERKGKEGKGRGKEGKGNTPRLALPDWVPIPEWDAFSEMREKKDRKGWTDRAKELAIGTLDRFRNSGCDPAEILNQSTMNGWKGLFEVRKAAGDGRNNQSSQRKAQGFAAGAGDSGEIDWAGGMRGID